MSYRITFEKGALQELRKLDQFLAKRIIKKIKEVKDNPFRCDIKRLRNHSSFRLRVGDYGVLFELSNNEIKVLKIGHRKNIYDFH